MQKRTKIIIGIIIAVIIILFLIFVYPGNGLKINGNATETSEDSKASLVVRSCKDTDGGIIYNTLGTITFTTSTGIRKVRNDFCLNSSYLREWYCTVVNKNNVRRYADYLCKNGCLNGSCAIVDYEDSPFGIYWRRGHGWWRFSQPSSDLNRFNFTRIDEEQLDASRAIVHPENTFGENYPLRITGQLDIYQPFEHCTCYNDSSDPFYDPFCATNFRFDEKGHNYKYCNETNFVNFIKKMVERYDGDNDYGCVVSAPDCYTRGDNQYPSEELRQAITENPRKIWEGLNEPDYGGFFRAVPYSISFKELTANPKYIETQNRVAFEIQRVFYNAVKSVCSDCKVTSPGYSNGAGGGQGRYINAWTYIKSEIENGGKNYFDIFNFHVYDTYRDVAITVDEINKIAPGKEFLITETSCGTRFDYVQTHCGSETSQAEFLFKVMASGVGEKYKIIMWYMTQDFPETEPGFDNGLISLDGTKKLSYYTYKFLDEKLKDLDWSRSQRLIDGNKSGSQYSNIYAYKFTKKSDGSLVYVIWWDYWNSPSEKTKQVSIPVSFSGTAKITQSVAHFENGLLLQNSGEVYPNFFDVVNKQVSSGGQVSFILGQNPVYIEKG